MLSNHWSGCHQHEHPGWGPENPSPPNPQPHYSQPCPGSRPIPAPEAPKGNRGDTGDNGDSEGSLKTVAILPPQLPEEGAHPRALRTVTTPPTS